MHYTMPYGRPQKTHVLLFTSKLQTTAMFKALSLQYRKHIVFGEVRKTKSAAQTISKYSVQTFPTLLAIREGGSSVKHTGSASHISLSFFLDKFVAPKTEL